MGEAGGAGDSIKPGWSEAEPQGDEAQEKDEPALASERTMKNDFIHGDTIRCDVISGPTSVAHFVGS